MLAGCGAGHRFILNLSLFFLFFSFLLCVRATPGFSFFSLSLLVFFALPLSLNLYLNLLIMAFITKSIILLMRDTNIISFI